MLLVPPRPAPDLASRRDLVLRTARNLAESEGWAALTMRRLAGDLGVTQPVLSTASDGRQALADAVALEGFAELAQALEQVEATPRARTGAYLEFAAAHPRTYEAVFSLPSGLTFGRTGTPAAMTRASSALAAAFPGEDRIRAEVAWSLLHGLSTLDAGGRLSPGQGARRLEVAHRLLTAPEQHP
jgi:AcrR family transcriptional regulator